MPSVGDLTSKLEEIAIVTLASLQNVESALELLAVNEETVGRLYSVYAERLPESSDFWNALAAEERSHARWIRRFKEEDASAAMPVKPDRFKNVAIRTSIDHTEGEIAAARVGNIKPTNALSIANAIEQSLIESKFFEVFETDSIDLKRLLFKLRDETREHARTVLESWSQHRFSHA